MQDAIVQDIEGGEKSAKALKGHLKEMLQACNGTPTSNGLAHKMSD